MTIVGAAFLFAIMATSGSILKNGMCENDSSQKICKGLTDVSSTTDDGSQKAFQDAFIRGFWSGFIYQLTQ